MASVQGAGCRLPYVWALCGLCLLGSHSATGAQQAPTGVQQGYQVEDSRIVVEGRRHWEHWKIPAHLAGIDSDGAVRSRQLRTVFNVLADKSFGRPVEIVDKKPRILNVDSTLSLDVLGNPMKDAQGNLSYDYVVRPGISRAGSNPQLAAHIVDGDPATFWEPDPQDPLDDWWIEVDLGRLVPLERLRLVFVDETLGDPFLNFVLLLAPTQNLFLEETRGVGFEVLVPFEGTNTTQREFVFDSARLSARLPDAGPALSSKKLAQGNADPNWTGKLVETIRIVVTDTRGGRAEPISQAAYEALPAAERGDIIYHVRDIAGFEEPVDSATYAELPEERRGQKEYYRRELPRLAEVEAWGWGDNFGPDLVKGGGSLELTIAGKNPVLSFDGNFHTYYAHNNLNPQDPGGNLLTADIGGTVWLDQVRFITSNTRGYVLRGSSGARDAQGALKWQTISPPERETNLDHGFFSYLNDLQEPPSRVRFLELYTLAHNREGISVRTDVFWANMREIMLFSSGSPAEVVLESDLIELPGLVTLGAVHWDADIPPGTDVEIRTRTGDQLIQRIRYFDKTGNEKTAKEYQKMLAFLKGPSDTSFVAGAGWSSWSQKYRTAGEEVTSPSRRQYLQIQARLLSHDRQAIPALRRLTVDLHPPVAQSLQAEVWPEQASAGQSDTFEVFLQPAFLEQPLDVRSLGFDELLLHAEPGLQMRLLDVAVGTEAEWVQGQPSQLFATPHEQGLVSATGDLLQVWRAQGDSLGMRFPAVVQSAPADVLEPLYYRQVDEGEEVPTTPTGQRLSVSSHAQLDPEAQGAIRYFRLLAGGEEPPLEEVDGSTYEALSEAEQGPIRYFRKVGGIGTQTLFDARGDTLTQAQYDRLSRTDRGWVVGRGRLIRLRFVAAVYLHGTRLKVAVRHSDSVAPWQEADADDITSLRGGQGLTIAALGAGPVIDAVAVQPNPFTPNDDGINDVAQIRFSLFKVYQTRRLTVGIFSLDGRRLRSIEGQGVGGQQTLAWDGRDDAGKRVVPGLYICQIEVDADADDVSGQRRAHLIAVAY